MKTDDLIEALALTQQPEAADQMRLRLVQTAGLGLAFAFVVMMIQLGLRPDLLAALADPMIWTKLAYGGAMGLAGYLAIERLARPDGNPRRGSQLGLLGLTLILAAGGLQLGLAPSASRVALILGQSAAQCPGNIAMLSLPVLAVLLLAVRRMAPVHPMAAGAACGLFSGGLATAIYALHCPESSLGFVAIWYSLGMVLSLGLGALLGPFVLRWR